MRIRAAFFLLGACLLLLTGCSDFIDQDQLGTAGNVPFTFLETGHSMGQTFVAHHGGLNAVELGLSPDPGTQGTLILHLRNSPLDRTDLITSTVSIGNREANGLYRFSFSPIQQSHTHYYYAFVEKVGPGRVAVPGGAKDAYADGTLYYDDQPQDAQAVFRLSYDAVTLSVAMLLMLGSWLAYGMTVAAILFFAGYWLVRRYTRSVGADLTTTLILSAVSFLALFLLLLVWANLVNLRFSSWGVRALVALSALVGLIVFLKDRRQWQTRQFWLGTSPWATLAFWIAVLSSIGVRLFIGQSMVMLPGSDTYHHTLIVELFDEQGGIPQSYAPYAPLVSYSYHFAFHGIVALFRWLFNTELLATTKTIALVLNGAIAAVIGLACEQITGHRRAAAISATFIGLILVSPFCLLLWGRFTQTAGLLFLGSALWALMAKPKETGWVLPPLLIAALILSHYRIMLYGWLFIGCFGIISLVRRDWDLIKRWSIMGAVALIITLPWTLHVAWVQSDPNHLILTYPVLGGYNSLDRLGQPVLGFATNNFVLICSVLLIAAGWLARGKRPLWIALIVWGIVMVGGAVVFPRLGLSFWDLTTTVLSIPIPLALLVGLGADAIWGNASGRIRWTVPAIVSIAFVGAATIGASRLPGLTRTGLSYLGPGDLVTMRWIRENTPEDAVFMPEAIQFAWSPGWEVGIDSGYWLPLLTDRPSILPPMIYGLEWSNPSEVAHKLEPYRALQAAMSGEQDALGMSLNEVGVNYVMMGPLQWSMPRSLLAQDTHLRSIYKQDRIEIFKVLH